MRPTVIKPFMGHILVIIPSREDNRSWLKTVGYKQPTRTQGKGKDHERWRVNRQHFDDLVKACVERFGLVQVESWGSAEIECSKICLDDLGDDCICSCCGAHHGESVGRHWDTKADSTSLIDDHVRRRYIVGYDQEPS